MSVAPLIEKKFLKTSFGNIAYLETGKPETPPVLLTHGIPTSGYLWRHALRNLQDEFHCYAPDLMGLGDTEVDPDKELFHMDAQAEMLAEFMTGLGHERFSLVCHDQGGAAAEILATRYPERINCWVITDSVCYDNWPVPVIAKYQKLARFNRIADFLGRRGFFALVETRTPFSAFRRGVYDPRKMTDETIKEYLRPLRSGEAARKRFFNFLLAGDERYTMQIVEELKKFDKPTLIIWAADDYYISPSWGRKLFEDIPGAKDFHLVPFCGHYWQEDRPSEFISKIREFLERYAEGDQSKR